MYVLKYICWIGIQQNALAAANLCWDAIHHKNAIHHKIPQKQKCNWKQMKAAPKKNNTIADHQFEFEEVGTRIKSFANIWE